MTLLCLFNFWCLHSSSLLHFQYCRYELIFCIFDVVAAPVFTFPVLSPLSFLSLLLSYSFSVAADLIFTISGVVAAPVSFISGVVAAPVSYISGVVAAILPFISGVIAGPVSFISPVPQSDYCKSPIVWLSSSKILNPIPFTARRVCTPRLWCGGRTHSLGGEGG